MLDDDLQNTLNEAFRYAKKRRHELVTIEHLLLALLDNASAIQVLTACNADLEKLRTDLDGFIEKMTPVVSGGLDDYDTEPTEGFQRVLRSAIFHVQSSGRKKVDGANVIVAIFTQLESHAVYFLKLQHIERLDVVNYIAHGDRKTGDEWSRLLEAPMGRMGRDKDEPDDEPSALELYASNLNEQAKRGEIDPLVGRMAEVERVVQTLSRRRKNNPLLVGEAGVGKTAIVEGLARMIVDGQVPEVIKDSTVHALDLGALVAGTKYRGDFERRLKGLFAELKETPDQILFIDEIHTMIGAGSASGSAMDASNLLKPLLSAGAVRCIGSTTYQEYRGIFDKDHALSRRFQKIDVEEPSIEDTYQILKGLKLGFEEHHHVKYTDRALRSAAELAEKYINDRMLPDKAIDVVDEVGAYQRLQPVSRRKKQISVGDVEQMVAKIARIPPRNVSSTDKNTLKDLEANLKMVIFGQDDAIQSLASSIKLARAGLREDGKPIGAFLLAGPTGVGKTEVCRQLASIMGIGLVRFDMSEYMERHTVSRLIGSPPGYVGFDQGGQLTEAVTKQPHCVLLLDEIEKAHPEVFNLLLQVFDHGTLTDNNGRKADFRNIVIAMTTNAGAQEMSRSSIGFTTQDHSSDGMEIIKKWFTPEFRNRLDAIIQFGALSKDVIKTVVDKFLVEIQVQLDSKKVQLEIDDSARDWLADNGYDEKMGARPMQRLIQEKIKKGLAEDILFGKLSHGGVVRVVVNDGDLVLDIEEPAKETT